MYGLLLRISRSGTPLVGWDVVVDGTDLGVRTDARGSVRVQIDSGRHTGRVARGGDALDFEFVCAPGLVDLQVDLRQEESDLDDPSVMNAMPSDRYRPLRLLGEGSAGSVYQCRDVVLDRLVAVKLLNPEVIGGGNAREAFLAEARALARLEHDCLISIYDMGFKDGRAFLVTRFVDGPDLETVVESDGPLRLPSLAVTGERLARALSAVHETGFVHQDVKPSNCLVDRRGRVFLGDFGLATRLEDVVDQREQVSGTPAYMAPELVLGMQVGPATDVYALGATLYHLALGTPPFVGHGPALLRAHVKDPVVSLREKRPDLPQWFDELVVSMLAKEAAARPSDRAVIDAFKEADIAGQDETLGAFAPRDETQQLQVRPMVEAWTRAGITSLISTSLVALGEGELAVSAGGETLDADAVGSTRAMALSQRRGLGSTVLVILIALVLIWGLASFLRGGSEDAPTGEQDAPTDDPAVELVPQEAPPEAPSPTPKSDSPTLVPGPPPVEVKTSPKPEAAPSPSPGASKNQKTSPSRPAPGVDRSPRPEQTPAPEVETISPPDPVPGSDDVVSPNPEDSTVGKPDTRPAEPVETIPEPVTSGPDTEETPEESPEAVPAEAEAEDEAEDEVEEEPEPTESPKKTPEPVLPPVSF